MVVNHDLTKAMVPIAVLLGAVVGTATIVWKVATIGNTIERQGVEIRQEIRDLSNKIEVLQQGTQTLASRAEVENVEDRVIQRVTLWIERLRFQNANNTNFVTPDFK